MYLVTDEKPINPALPRYRLGTVFIWLGVWVPYLYLKLIAKQPVNVMNFFAISFDTRPPSSRVSLSGVISAHLPPFQKLDCGEDIHTDGGDADGPFCVSAEVE